MCPSARAPPVPVRRLASSATKSPTTQKAESFKSQGILQPLVVRAKPGGENKYEVVAGARRLRAAQLAELKTVPVRVVELSDAASIEAH